MGGFVSKEAAAPLHGVVAPPNLLFCTPLANISMHSSPTKEVVSGSLSGATQDSDSGDWTQLFPPQDQGLKGTRLLDFQITTRTLLEKFYYPVE